MAGNGRKRRVLGGPREAYWQRAIERIFHISRAVTGEAIRRGELPAYEIPHTRGRVILRSDLLRWLAAYRVRPAADDVEFVRRRIASGETP